MAPPITIVLPHEILGEIFIASCPTPQDNSITDVNGARSMVLASVCKSWRNVTLSTPELWSKFQYYANTTHQGLNRLVPLKHHLERSGSFPLTFIIKPPQQFKSEDELHSPLLDLIFRHAHHWGDATVFFSSDLIYEKLANVGEFPVLHTFRAFELAYLTSSPFLQAPHLRYLEFSKSQIFPSNLEYPWSYITSVSIWLGLTDVLEILRRSTQLEHLQIHSAYLYVEVPGSLETSQLRSLYFTVAKGEEYQFEQILSRTALPAVVRIEVSSDSDVCADAPMPHTTFLHFLSRCNSLQELAVHLFEMTYDQLFEYPLIASSMTLLEATIDQEILTVEFEKALDRLFAQSARLNAVKIMGFDDGIHVEYYAARSETDGVSKTITYINAGLLF